MAIPPTPRRLRKSDFDLGRQWRETALKSAPQKTRFLKIARDPKASAADFAAARAAALLETEQWQAHARKWDFAGQPIQNDVMLSAEELSATDTQRVELVAVDGDRGAVGNATRPLGENH
jgi:hypothetical protein